MPPRLRHTVEQILAKLREAEVALRMEQSVAHVCRAVSITEQTYYRRRNEYGGLQVDQASGSKTWSGRTPARSGPLPTSPSIN